MLKPAQGRLISALRWAPDGSRLAYVEVPIEALELVLGRQDKVQGPYSTGKAASGPRSHPRPRRGEG